MYKKIIALLTIYLMHHSVAFSQMTKIEIDNIYKKNIAYIKKNLGDYCSDQGSNLFFKLNYAHDQLFLKDRALEAVLKNIEVLEAIDLYQRPGGCNFSIVAVYMVPKLYMQYYFDEHTLSVNKKSIITKISLTEEERTDLKNSYKFAHDTMRTLCKQISCAYNEPAALIGYFEAMNAEIQRTTPDYMDLLNMARTVRHIIINSYLTNKIPDERYFTAISKINQNMRIMFLIPKKYLYDLKERPLFRDKYLSKMVEYMMNVDDHYSKNYIYLSSYFSYIYYESDDDELLEIISDTQRIYEAFTHSSVKSRFDHIEPWITDLPLEFSREAKNIIKKLQTSRNGIPI
ncbi:hypothetical protein [Legionella shakespearei]|uniref:Coiled-coil protein n=1 Tax=Legionella shakespearei DSM 23087 TaxID=1122169 RepID=A0A0W0YZU7_9GAMM|nr:hypothetical protein [Legionella shakespearei]KTD62386.1 hypothetical protein Lsha_1086 [Legionella shakespearei DSM 23087]